MADAAALPPLSVAQRPDRPAHPHRHRAGTGADRQGDRARPALRLPRGGGRDDHAHQHGGDGRDILRHRLFRRALRQRRVRQCAQHGVRACRAGRHTPVCRRRLPAPAPALAALPPVAPHGRDHQDCRARDQEHRHDALFPAVQHRAHADRTDRGGGDLLPQFRHRAGAGDRDYRRAVYRGDADHYRMAHQAAARDERPRRAGARTRGRFAAELRDGQIFRRRSARARTLRQGDAPIFRSRHQVGRFARPAQHRAVAHHQPADGGCDGLHRVGLEPGQADHGRSGVRADLPDAAVPPARHARLRLSHDPAGADRHGGDVPSDGRRCRSEGCARRALAAYREARHHFRGRAFRLRRGPRDPARARFPDRRGRDGGAGRSDGRGQEHHRAAAVPLLRSADRAHPDRRAGYRARDAGQLAREHRHRPAGQRAVQRHHRLQYRLRPPARARRCRAGRDPGGSARRGDSLLYRSAAAGLRDAGGRTRAQAVWRREAAGRDCAHAAERPADRDSG